MQKRKEIEIIDCDQPVKKVKTGEWPVTEETRRQKVKALISAAKYISGDTSKAVIHSCYRAECVAFTNARDYDSYTIMLANTLIQYKNTVLQKKAEAYLRTQAKVTDFFSSPLAKEVVSQANRVAGKNLIWSVPYLELLKTLLTEHPEPLTLAEVKSWATEKHETTLLEFIDLCDESASSSFRAPS